MIIVKTFDITTYGAIGDGKTDNALAIQKAIDDCSRSGGGIVRVPEGQTFLTGPFNLKSFVNLRVEENSTLLANPDESVYTQSAFRENVGEGSIWIGAENAKEVTISGKGAIDGNGAAFMGPEEKAAYALKPFVTFDRRPHVFTPVHCTGLSIHDVTFKNSAYWCLHLVGCSNVSIAGVKIYNDLKIRNSDGIDLDHSSNVLIKDCDIESGDDCICFKTRREYAEYGPTEHVVVSGCSLTSTSCAIKLGSENVDAIRDILVHDCTIRSSNRGIGLQNRDEGRMQDINFKNISVEGRLFDDVWWGKAEPISVTVYKRAASKGKDANVRFAKGQTEGNVGAISRVTFSGISCRSENGIFVGGESDKVHGIEFSDVHLQISKTTKYAGGVYDLRPSDTVGILQAPTAGFYLLNAKDVSLKNCSVHWGEKKTPYFKHALYASEVAGLRVDNFAGNGAQDGIKAIQCDRCESLQLT